MGKTKPEVITKKPREGIIDIQKVEKALEIIKKYALILKAFFGDKQHEKGIIVIWTILSCSLLGYNITNAVLQNQTYNKETTNIEKLEKYNIQQLEDNPNTNNVVSSATTISDLLKINANIQKETQRYEDHKAELQSSYTNFLQYLLVPGLNIRKAPYTDSIDTNLIGSNFLDKNPFNDINLYQKWSNFFGSTEKNEINSIDNLEIGNITETDFGLYSMKISFSFIAPSKNALLFLADKISTTSDKDNISLLGEFVYYLRQQIKSDKETEIEALTKDPDNKEIATNQDQIIGKSLYNWVLNNWEAKLIDDKVINKTIKNIMECWTQSDTECLYKFRDKFRNIAELAYTLGDVNNNNKTRDLQNFFKNLPPLMAVQRFTYNKIINTQVLDQSITYQGNIELEIYGQNITPNDISEIAKVLWKKCFGTEKEISPSMAIDIINQSSSKSASDTSKQGDASLNKINDLKNILDGINTEYPTLNNYKKTIRLFEVYRTLNEGWFCTTI